MLSRNTRAEILSKGHVNNVLYNRYAETGRVEWALKYAKFIDPAHRETWEELVTPKSIGLILKSIKTEYKFVCCPTHGEPFQMRLIWMPSR